MSLPLPTLYDGSKHENILPQLAQIHADCVLTDGTMASFLPNKDREMDMAKLLAFYQNRASQVDADTRAFALQFTDDNEMELAGFVSLSWAGASQTGPFRSEVGTLLVSPKHRRKGVARRVMEKLEEVAREKGKELIVSGVLSSFDAHAGYWRIVLFFFPGSCLTPAMSFQMLDTTIGTEAEHVYPKLGYTRVGVVPKYGISPKTGELLDEVWFYKDLRDHSRSAKN